MILRQLMTDGRFALLARCYGFRPMDVYGYSAEHINCLLNAIPGAGRSD